MQNITLEIDKFISEKDVTKFNNFVATLEAKSNFRGRRWFCSAQSKGDIAPNDLVRYATAMYENVKDDATKKQELKKIILIIKQANAKSDAEMGSRNCLTQVLDVATRFFGSFIYDRTSALKQLKTHLFHHPLLPYKTKSELHDEFHAIPYFDFSAVHPIFSHAVQHHSKNRYYQVVPFNQNRFKAPEHFDYINASLILNKTAIATQAPLSSESELATFWKMAHLSGSTQIVMVTNLKEGPKEKASQYWPELNQTVTYQNVTVTSKGEEIVYQEGDTKKQPYILRRCFEVTYQGVTREIAQIHFVNWMDNKVVSPTSLCQLVKACKAPTKEDPVIVHCSAGIGRTGTFLATAHLYFNQIKKQIPLQKRDLFNTVSKMRKPPSGRPYMVSTAHQYALIWRSLTLLNNN